MHSREMRIDTTLEVMPLPSNKAFLTATHPSLLRTGKQSRRLRYDNFPSYQSTTNREVCTACTTAKASLSKVSIYLFPQRLRRPVPFEPCSKTYRPESVERFGIQWVESTSGLESYQERHCRSNSLLGHLDGDLIP